MTKAVVVAGGTGGAKLAAGMQELLGDELTVIANTGDDVETLGVHVSPDPDLITYWLAGEIDEQRGWGIRGDTTAVFERLVSLGEPGWFELGDRDLATCLRRKRLLDAGVRTTEVQVELSRDLGARARVLPMCDEPVRSRVRTAEGWRDFQQFMVLERAEPEIEALAFDGVDEAAPTPEVREALADAEAIVIGPSNPVISVGPVLAIPGMREAIASGPAPVVAVSPLVAGRSVKGPTEACMRAVGLEVSTAGVVEHYDGLLDGLVADEGDPEPPPETIRSLVAPTLMADAAARVRVAELTLEFAHELGAR